MHPCARTHILQAALAAVDDAALAQSQLPWSSHLARDQAERQIGDVREEVRMFVRFCEKWENW
jgi:hypothetical protein